MILSHEDLSEIERCLGPEKAAPIIHAFEKIEQEQTTEVKKALLMELATKADLAELRGATKADLVELRGATKADLAELRGATKADLAELGGAVKGAIAELRGELKRVEAEMKVLLKVLIGLVVIAMSFFSPVGTEIIKLLK